MKAHVLLIGAAVAAMAAAGYEFPERAIWQEGKGGCVLDVTRPPFNAKGDGVHDDTAALRAALRFAHDGFRVETTPDGETHWQQVKTKNWIVYLPKGTYRVTDTLDQGWPALALNLEYGWNHIRYLNVQSPVEEDALYAQDVKAGRGGFNQKSVYAEANWQVMILGAGRDLTVIRLDDGARGFGKGAEKPVVCYALLKAGSNVSLGNFLEDLTIDTGRDNPGAVGCLWACSNYGGLRRVRIRSADGRGRIGALMDRRNACGYWRDVEVDGFEIGIFHRAGFESTVTFEDCLVRNSATGVAVGAPGVCSIASIVNVRCEKTAEPISRRGNGCVAHIGCTRDGVEIPDSAADLPRTGFPRLPHAKGPSEWTTPEDFGAVGDGVRDDTEAVRRAFGAGRLAVVFTRPLYRIDGVVPVPASLREVNFLHAGVVRHAHSSNAVFRVGAAADEPVVFRNGYFAGGILVDHAAVRPVVLEDLHGEFHHVREGAFTDGVRMPVGGDREAPLWYLYRNATPQVRKTLYAADCITLSAGGAHGEGALENVSLLARHINNENFPGRPFAFRDSVVRIVGGKCEGLKTVFSAERSDVRFCGLYALGGVEAPAGEPFAKLVDSRATLTGVSISSVRPMLEAVRDGRPAGKSFAVCENGRAFDIRERADWMRGSVGVGVHWTAGADAADGKPVTFEEAVNGFDVAAFADALAQTGARHIIFTLAHAEQRLPMPNAALDRIAPGRTSKRDLFGEILDACAAKGIRVVAYYNHSCNGGDPGAAEWMRQVGCPCQGGAGDMSKFSANVCAIVGDISRRYGGRIAGWWFDSPYSVDSRGSVVACKGEWSFPWTNLVAAARSGNAQAAIAINGGIGRRYQYCDEADCYAGESVAIDQAFDGPADPRLVDTRWITADDRQWVFSAKRGYVPLRFGDRQLADYVLEHTAAERMVTFNVLIDRRGRFSPHLSRLKGAFAAAVNQRP